MAAERARGRALNPPGHLNAGIGAVTSHSASSFWPVPSVFLHADNSAWPKGSPGVRTRGELKHRVMRRAASATLLSLYRGRTTAFPVDLHGLVGLFGRRKLPLLGACRDPDLGGVDRGFAERQSETVLVRRVATEFACIRHRVVSARSLPPAPRAQRLRRRRDAYQ